MNETIGFALFALFMAVVVIIMFYASAKIIYRRWRREGWAIVVLVIFLFGMGYRREMLRQQQAVAHATSNEFDGRVSPELQQSQSFPQAGVVPCSGACSESSVRIPTTTQPSPATPASSAAVATLSQQKTCSEQAEKYFNSENFKTVGYGYPFYVNHYDASTGMCYIQTIWQNTRIQVIEIANPFEHNVLYGQYTGEKYGDVLPRGGDCYVEPPGQPPIHCKSAKEFNDLALKYFGLH